jgi:chemotaxis protein MotB
MNWEPAAESGEVFSPALSIGDLMAALLMIFILALSGTLLTLTRQREINRERLDRISEQEHAKRRIISRLISETADFNIEVDRKTGAIRVRDAVLFAYGESTLKPEGRRFLRRFIPAYARVLLESPKVREQIGHIVIEGHTDDIGGYVFNLQLSLDRAQMVAAEIFSDTFPDFPYKPLFRKRLSVNGRSFENPLSSLSSEAGRRKNRRVEFKFTLIDWTAVETIGVKRKGTPE